MSFDVGVWFEGFWAMYDSKLCGGGPQKGSKSMALKSALKRIKDESTGKRVLMALAAQKKYFYDCQKNNEFHAKFPHAVTWLNQERWEIEIDSHAELKEKAGSKLCSCGNEMAYMMKDRGICHDCYVKIIEPNTWRYKACRAMYKRMVIDSPEENKTAYEKHKAIAKAFLKKQRK